MDFFKGLIPLPLSGPDGDNLMVIALKKNIVPRYGRSVLHLPLPRALLGFLSVCHHVIAVLPRCRVAVQEL